MSLHRPRCAAVALATTLVLAGCTGGSDDAERTVSRTPTRAIDAVDPATPAGSAAAVSRRLFERSATVVLAAPDADSQRQAADAAGRLHVPMLVTGPEALAEIKRLRATTVLAVGPSGTAWPEVRGLQAVTPDPQSVRAAVRDLPTSSPTTQDVVVLTESPRSQLAATTTARVAGATVVRVPGGDVRAVDGARTVLRDRKDARVLGIGRELGHGLGYEVMAVRRDLTQPGGGLLVFPGRHVVALYGHPGTPSLGLLGEQGTGATIKRAARYARQYQRLSDQPVVPALEIIATVASGGPGKDGDYSAESSVRDLLPLVSAAEQAGQYVVIDLQPGRTDFLTQAKRYRSLLERPHVGLALDPEWRLARGQKHLRQIGSVSAAEVNEVSAWLADLTREKRLPQKPFVLHQFSLTMIRDRSTLVTDHPELATVVHVDGQGTQGAKRGTWDALRRDAPAGLRWGWKNFLDEDEPMLTPSQTWAVRPRPDLVTYQ